MLWLYVDDYVVQGIPDLRMNQFVLAEKYWVEMVLGLGDREPFYFVNLLWTSFRHWNERSGSNYEDSPRTSHQKANSLHMRKQRHRSVVQ